jgi:Zn-dependent M28 family amino/carboxypeptidase
VRRTHLTVALSCAAMLLVAPAALAKKGDRTDTEKLRKGVTVSGILEHEEALQRLAIANGGNRAAGTPGYRASVDYVVNRLRAAGYRVNLDGFDFPIWTVNGPATLAELTPTARTFTEDSDYIVAQFATGDVTANIVPTNDIQIPPPGGAGTGTSGCEASDFPASTAGNIALMQRGTCTFTAKYANAKAAGAAGALIFNDGVGDRIAPIGTTAPGDVGIPAAMISSTIGESLYQEAQAGPVSVHFAVDATVTPNIENNVIADSRSGDPERTIVIGAHLDSVMEGPGINDNGSGTSSILEIAEQIARLKDKPRNRVRFAFWGAEEAGLVGSTAYVDEQVENGGIEDIEANLNFDMLASVNFVRFVYDGDTSDFPPPAGGAPAGSAQIEHIFTDYFDRKRLASDPTAFDGRSDYGAFIANGVPAGGLFSGAEGTKTAAQEADYGGFAGMPYDPCYHVPPTNGACDDFFNLNYTSLDQMSDAAAHTTWTLAESRTPISEVDATAAKKKSKKAKRGKAMRFKGPFRVR